MAKGKAKLNNSDSLASAQPRSLRSRKRECPSEEISETDGVQDTEGKNTAVEATLLQVQLSAVVSIQQDQAAEQAYPTKQDPVTEQKHADATNVTVKASEEQEETTDACPNNDSQLEVFGADKSGGDKEEITADECNKSSSQTGNDQPHVFMQTSEEEDGSCTSALEEQPNEKSHCDVERNQETGREESSNAHMADVKVITKEAAARLPAKKKRRMGMCGLTEKERSHILQTQKCDNRKNETEREEPHINDNAVAQGEMISSPSLPSSFSIPVGTVSEQNQAEIELQSGHCEGNDRAEPEVHMVVTTSDGTNAVCDPGCCEKKRWEAEGCTMPDPEETTDPMLGLLAEKKEEEDKQMKDGEDGSAVDQSPTLTTCSNPTQNEETEGLGATEASFLQVNSVIMTRDEKKEELIGDDRGGDGAEAGASSTESQSVGFNCGSVELCEATVTSSGSERKDSSDPEDKPDVGPFTVNAVHSKTRDDSDPCGSGCLDYVSDSQLNTIYLTEEEVMEKEEVLGFPDCHEDASDLLCGLIRELSSLNRKVMATHRELENLRRSTKSSRSSTR